MVAIRPSTKCPPLAGRGSLSQTRARLENRRTPPAFFNVLDWETDPWQPRLEQLIAHGMLQVEDLDVALPVVLQLADRELPDVDSILTGLTQSHCDRPRPTHDMQRTNM